MIFVASDHAGFALKQAIVGLLRARGEAVEDLGCDSEVSVDYPVYAARVADRVATGDAARGVLVCGSGIGMSIVANRFRGVRAALCGDIRAAELSRRHNDANVLCLAGRIVSPDEADSILRVFLETPFDGGRHEGRVKLIDEIT